VKGLLLKVFISLVPVMDLR